MSIISSQCQSVVESRRSILSMSLDNESQNSRSEVFSLTQLNDKKESKLAYKSNVSYIESIKLSNLDSKNSFGSKMTFENDSQNSIGSDRSGKSSRNSVISENDDEIQSDISRRSGSLEQKKSNGGSVASILGSFGSDVKEELPDMMGGVSKQEIERISKVLDFEEDGHRGRSHVSNGHHTHPEYGEVDLSLAKEKKSQRSGQENSQIMSTVEEQEQEKVPEEDNDNTSTTGREKIMDFRVEEESKEDQLELSNFNFKPYKMNTMGVYCNRNALNLTMDINPKSNKSFRKTYSDKKPKPKRMSSNLKPGNFDFSNNLKKLQYNFKPPAASKIDTMQFNYKISLKKLDFKAKQEKPKISILPENKKKRTKKIAVKKFDGFSLKPMPKMNKATFNLPNFKMPKLDFKIPKFNFNTNFLSAGITTNPTAPQKKSKILDVPPMPKLMPDQVRKHDKRRKSKRENCKKQRRAKKSEILNTIKPSKPAIQMAESPPEFPFQMKESFSLLKKIKKADEELLNFYCKVKQNSTTNLNCKSVICLAEINIKSIEETILEIETLTNNYT